VDWNRIFLVVSTIMSSLVDFVNEDTSDSLFTSSRDALNRLVAMSTERVNVVGFQGKLLGFQVNHLQLIVIVVIYELSKTTLCLNMKLFSQFCKSVRTPLQFVSNLMAAYSEVYQSEGFLQSSFTSSKACMSISLVRVIKNIVQLAGLKMKMYFNL